MPGRRRGVEDQHRQPSDRAVIDDGDPSPAGSRDQPERLASTEGGPHVGGLGQGGQGPDARDQSGLSGSAGLARVDAVRVLLRGPAARDAGAARLREYTGAVPASAPGSADAA